MPSVISSKAKANRSVPRQNLPLRDYESVMRDITQPNAAFNPGLPAVFRDAPRTAESSPERCGTDGEYLLGRFNDRHGHQGPSRRR